MYQRTQVRMMSFSKWAPLKSTMLSLLFSSWITEGDHTRKSPRANICDTSSGSDNNLSPPSDIASSRDKTTTERQHAPGAKKSKIFRYN
jgi:hypothetical protein